MGAYILRRLGQSALTILGVMVITFLLFRVVAGDIASARLGEKSTEQQRAAWRHRYGYDKPLLLNLDRQLLLLDKAGGGQPLTVRDPRGGNAANALALVLAGKADYESQGIRQGAAPSMMMGRYVFRLSRQTPLSALTAGKPMVETLPPSATAPAETQAASAPAPEATNSTSAPAAAPELPPIDHTVLLITLTDGSELAADLSGAGDCGELIDRINTAPGNNGRLEAMISGWSYSRLLDSQFFHHLWESVTFQSRSLKDNQKLTVIIAAHAPASLAVQIPALAIEWVLAMIVASFVAYYRGSLLDKVGVFLSVLGMCIPFLAFMIYGQWLMFEISPTHAYGIDNRVNVYLPVAIMVVAGLGSQVRFYRTIILDETNRDYVRTAKAKGLPLTAVLFKHVLRNCMLPILTSLILTIPFLFMGGLLVESYFGIPGLGDLMLTSIQDRNEPVMSGMVFLTALIYTAGVLLTDISYALFDPRIRLR